MGLLAVAGCDSPEPAGARLTPYEQSLQTIEGSERALHRYGIDRAFEELGRKIPGFAGVYYEGDRLIVSGKNPSRINAHRAEILERFPAEEVEVRAVHHSFIELSAAATAMAKRGHPEGVTMVDIDERLNLVRIGFDPSVPQTVEALTERSLESGAPPELFLFEPREPPTSLYSLRESARPTLGGLGINQGDCTVWNVSGPNWQRAFATAAHCLDPVGSMQSVEVFQYINNVTSKIGEEWKDPPFADYWSRSVNCAVKDCRLSDMAMGLYDDGVKATRGLIARPSTKDPHRGDIEYGGKLRVAHQYSYPVEGQTLAKVGQVTGWTYGEVEQTCVDLEKAENGYWILCSDLVGAGAWGGDSGSPVFRELGADSVGMYGILHAGEGQAQQNNYGYYFPGFWMSSFDMIDREFDITWPVEISVAISGDGILAPWETGTWAAIPTRGNPPREFRWYRDGTLVSTDSVYSGGWGETFFLSLEMQVRHGWFASTSKQVVIRDDDGGGWQ